MVKKIERVCDSSQPILRNGVHNRLKSNQYESVQNNNKNKKKKKL